jgi:hypothetical protein
MAVHSDAGGWQCVLIEEALQQTFFPTRHGPVVPSITNAFSPISTINMVLKVVKS